MNSEKKYLYKYCPINKPFSFQNLQKILIENELNFSSPLVLNDPYDCKAPLSFECDDKEVWEKYFEYLVEVISVDLPSPKQKMEQLISGGSYKDRDFKDRLQQAFREEFKKQSETLLIASFSQGPNPDNLLLWSHYSDNHEGYCLVFDMEAIPSNSTFSRVDYNKDYPSLQELMSGFAGGKQKSALDNPTLRLSLLRKPEVWSYENEYRLLAFSKENKGKEYCHLKVPDNLLTGVVYGCRMDDAKKEEIKEIVEKREQPLKQYQADLKKNEYGLDIFPIT